MEVILKDVYHGRGPHNSHVIYASLYSEDGLQVSATLDYCMEAVKYREWKLVTKFSSSED